MGLKTQGVGRRILITFATVWFGVLSLCASADDERAAFFESTIRPVLIERCFECHGQADVESGLRVDSRDALLAGGGRGPAIVAGHADESLLIEVLRQTDGLGMPPDGVLSDREVADFARWINDGAHWPDYEPITIRTAGEVEVFPTLSPDDASFQQSIEAWYRADGQPWADGQSVYLWQDASGRGHDLAATAGGRQEGTGQPARYVHRSSIHGFPAVRFDMETGLGGNAATAPGITGDAEFTMFVVGSIRSVPPGVDGLIAGFGDPAPPSNPARALCAILGIPAANPRPLFVGGWGNDAAPVAAEGTVIFGTPTIFSVTKVSGPLAATTRFHVNGLETPALSGNDAVPDIQRRQDLGFFMGHARSWLRGFEGDVAEVVLSSRALTDDERTAVEGYLSTKFHIPLVGRTSREPVIASDPAFHKPHWAFATVADSEVPLPEESGHPIDRFLKVGREARGLRPVAQADPRTLVRRLFFDVTGLPPTPEQMASAVASLTPWDDGAWADLVEELLASPHYGERWGRHWLDVARYADTAGDNADYPIPEARLYRDYVIDAFNADMPYDQFVREQLAGDLLAPDGPRERYADQVIATGFLALTRRYATGPYELWHLSLEDTIDTVGQAFMGMTMRCARCHDHKFDPISQRDYYALYGIFESTQFPWAGAEEFHSQQTPRLHFATLVPPDEAEPLRAAWEQTRLSSDPGDEQAMARFRAADRTGYPPEIPGAYAVSEAMPRPAVLHISGDPKQLGPIVARGVLGMPVVLPMPEVPAEESGRRQLADWLTDHRHPLTARVMVNRIWQHHFGQGLVATPSNFGTRGSPPTHPELLDWLAQRFVESGWSIKAMHRLILSSHAWRLSSDDDPENAAIDPANAFLWRHDRRRLDAESIRDSLLAISGRLDPTRPGPHPFPPITDWAYTQHSQFREFYPSTHRSVYLMTTRLQRHPFLALFDGPDTNTTNDVRGSSIVPAQALYLMNSEDVQLVASAFADRVLAVPPDSRIARAFALAFQRSPTEAERAEIATFLAGYTERTHDEHAAWTACCRAMLISHEAFYVD